MKKYMRRLCMAERKKSVQYMCTYCGRKETRREDFGRPLPGTCPRRGKNMPHRWVVNRRI